MRSAAPRRRTDGEDHPVPSRAAIHTGRFIALLALQHGVVSRKQALEHGLTDGVIVGHLNARRWQRALPGVYLTFTGPVPSMCRVWAAILYAGPGAMASHETAAWLSGLRDDLPPLVDVTIPGDRRVRRQPGVRLYPCAGAVATRHPIRTPPQTRLEHTVIDLVAAAETGGQVVDVITRACQRRLTTADRLAEAAARRPTLRWRRLLGDVLEDVRDGVLSALERAWRRDVERAHGLPAGDRNRPEGAVGARRYRDVRYRKYRMIVELDGSAAHPEERRHQDMARDNLMSEDGERTLRYGWHAVTASPCEAAAQTARMLRRRGWQGRPRQCGPSCGLPPDLGAGEHDHRNFHPMPRELP
jgi:hypothetical protein